MATLERALEIALKAHQGSKDFGGNPYILHPLRVMMSLKSEQEKIVGILHDVVERSSLKFDDLHKEGFSGEVMAALELLGHDEATDYHDYIRSIKPNSLARIVKLADLEDNMHVGRISELDEDAVTRFRAYLDAWKLLKAQ
ncbi:MAG: GTP pyrophosphokinase [Verrucomicrobiales bacterium]